MATDVSGTYLRGFLIDDPRISADSLWTAQSTYTQAGPVPGDPEPQGTYSLVLSTSGTQPASNALRIKTQDGGHARIGEAGFIHQQDGDSTWLGWDPPMVLRTWEAIVWTDGGGVPVKTVNPHVVTLPDQTVIAVVYREQSGVVHQVATYTRDKDTGAWGSAVAVYAQSTAPAETFGPCLVVLPDGSVLCYHWVEDGTEANIRCHRSIDNGATWSVASPACLPDNIDISSTIGGGNAGYDLGRIRAAYSGGQVLLLAETRIHNTTGSTKNIDGWHQYASDSEGYRFTLIEELREFTTSEGLTDVAKPDVIATDDGFMVSAIAKLDSNSGTLGWFRMLTFAVGDAFEPLSSAVQSIIVVQSEITGGATTGNGAAPGAGAYYYLISGENSLVRLDSGEYWLYGQCIRATGFNGQGSTWSFRSIDGGSTWSVAGEARPSLLTSAAGCWYNSEQYDATIVDFAATQAHGRVMVLHNWTAATGNEDNSLGCFYLGGYTDLTRPGKNAFRLDTTRGGYSYTWLPFELPYDEQWTRTAAAGTQTLTSGRDVIATTAGNSEYNTFTLASGSDAGVEVEWEGVQLQSGGTLSGLQVGGRIIVDDGANSWQVAMRLQFSAARLRLYDIHGTAAIGADVTLDWANEYDFKLAVKSGSCQLWYRIHSTDPNANWTEGPGTTTLTSGATATAAVVFGHVIAAASDSSWGPVKISEGDSKGLSFLPKPTNPDDLFPRFYAGPPRALYVDDGVKLTARAGPSRAGDTFHVDTAYTYPISRVFQGVEPSPRVRWRSTDTTQHTIALALDTTLLGTKDSRSLNDTIGIGLFGINWRTGELQGYDSGTTSWVKLADIDAAQGLTSLKWDRDGNAVRPDATFAVNGAYLQFHEFAGGTYQFSATKFRRVLTNSEGKWIAGSTAKLPAIILDGIDDTEGNTGTSGSLWAPFVVVTVNLLNTTYAGFRLVIDSQTTADGYFEIGNIICGPVVFLGWDYDHGRRIRQRRGAVDFELPDGSTRVVEVAPEAREVSIPGISTNYIGGAQGATPSPNYLTMSTTAGARAVAAQNDSAMVLSGLHRLLDSGARGFVYLESMTRNSGAGSDTLTFNRGNQAIYLEPISEIEVTTTAGDDGQDELVEVGAFDARERV